MQKNREDRLVASSENILSVIREMGRQIRSDYNGRTPVIVGVLTGGYMFLSDLTKELLIDIEVDFVRVSSYHGNKKLDKPRIIYNVETDLTGRDVILVDDIADTGETITTLKTYLSIRKAKSVKVAVMFSRRSCPVKADYIGFEVDDEFLVGYGMDNNKLERNEVNVYSL